MPPPALLLHGFLGRGADWAPVARRLAETRRTTAPDWLDDLDLPAADRAPQADPFDVLVPRAGSLAWASDRLAERLDAEAIEQADVVGYSMGGRLALLFALRHPDRVRRLVLASASPGLKTPEGRAARRAHDAALARDLTDDFPAFLHRWTRQPVFASLSEAQRGAVEADRAVHVDPEQAARALVGMGTGAMPSLWEPLHGRLPAETHAVAGALDAKYVAVMNEMARAGVRPHTIPDAGHALLTEAPGALADLLLYLI